MVSTSKNAASLREELEDLYVEFRRMHFPASTNDERVRELHDILIMYTNDVSPAIMEVLKGPRRLFKVRHYLGIRKNRRVESLIRELSRSKLDVGVDDVLKEYNKRYAHMTKMIDVALALLKVRGRGDRN